MANPQFQYLTFGQAKQRLANELGDPSMVFWTNAELGRYIIEALRWWNLTAMYTKETGELQTVANQSFYFLEQSLFDTTGTVLLQGLDVTDQEIINDINYFIMEPPISNWSGGWIGTEMFSLPEITSILQDSRDEFLRMTACIATRYTAPVTTTRVVLPSNHIRILRADINEANSNGPLPIWVVDQVELFTTFRETHVRASSRPKAYTVSYNPQLTVDLWPEPQVESTLGVNGVVSGATLTPTGGPTVLGIPNDMSFLLKYRVMADLLSGDGLQRCPQIADYCDMRFQEGLDDVGSYLSLLWQNDGGPRGPITAVAQWDQVRPQWLQQPNTGSPRAVAQLNWNTIGIRPIPDTTYNITFECIRKAIIPTLDTDFLQVGKAVMQAIFDYAQHIAMIKIQGREFQSSMTMYKRARALALEYKQQIASQGYLYQATQLPSLQEKWFRPYRKQMDVQEAANDRKWAEQIVPGQGGGQQGQGGQR